ncbi:hypothetical protein BsWGS_08406 [Bradybaena similaris]
MQRSLKACIQPGREKDRDKMMQQKLAELGSHLQRLERCMAMLKAENDVLRQKQRDKRALEENVRLLRKRNAELATGSRRLEERVRALQERSCRNGQKAKSVSQDRPELNSRRRTPTGQTNKPNSTFRRTVGSRGREIDNLHRKCQKLTDLLNNTDDSTLQNASQFEEEEELIRIIKIAAKERLQLEHELANSRMKIGSHLTGPDSACLALSADISVVRHSPQCQQRLARALAENQQLHHIIKRLREQVASREQNAEEYSALKLSLAAAQKEKEEAEKEAKSLGRRVHSLENVVRDLQESAEHVTQLENQRKLAVQQLQQKQAQLEHLQQVTSTIETAHTEKLLALQQLVAKSEEKLRLEEASRLKLIQEVQRLREVAVEREKVAAELQHVKQELARQHLGISGQPGEEKYREIDQEVSRTSWNQHEQRSDDSLMSLWARNGPIQVYIAKYNYDPFQLSPNENPEAELTLTAGDYVLVVGDMDEDGFFDGELIDGSQGLVPSNFIEKVKDEDLCEFHEVLLHVAKWSNGTTADGQLSNSHQTGHTLSAPPSPVKESAPPCPRNLSLDKQLPDSVHISWTAPDPSPGLQVHKYHVLVDGETQAVIGGNERTKVTLEDISESNICRVCVRCLSNRGQSRDAQCTMLVGKDAYPGPTELTVLHLSLTSAVLTWLPGNSNYQHSVSINGQEVAVVRPGVFYHRLSELQPGMLYQGTVTIRSASGVSNITSQSWLKHHSASIEFSTPVVDQMLGTDTRQQSPSLMREVNEDQISILTELPVFQPLDSFDGEQKGLETDEEIEEAFRQVENSNEAVDEPSESSYTDSSRTELSDIPEVEEELLGSQDSQLNEAGASQAATKSPESTTDRSVHSETDDHPREFHAEKPAEFDGKPLAAPTPLTPTIVMQNHVTKQGIEEENLPSTHSTPTNFSSEQPALDIHISRAFLTVDQTQQKNILNCIHLVSVQSKVGDEIIDSQDSNQTYKPPPAISDSANPRLDPSKEALTNKFIENETQPGNHVVRLPVSSYRPLESSNDPGAISGDVSPVITAANSVRLFIALFDYHPATMSPNVDCTDEELSFREGQILKVFGHKDADGFYKGESNGRMGYIPCNLVCEVQVDNPELRQQLLQDIAEIPGEPQAVPCQQPTDSPVMTDGRSSVPINCLGRKMIAMYDYNPQELSPNPDVEVELPLTAGDIVTVYGDMDEDGFFTGTINNRHGLVPSNFLQALPTTNYRSDQSLDIILAARERQALYLNDEVTSQCQQSKSDSSRPDDSKSEVIQPAAPEDKSKKGGFFSRGKQIFKIFT